MTGSNGVSANGTNGQSQNGESRILPNRRNSQGGQDGQPSSRHDQNNSQESSKRETESDNLSEKASDSEFHNTWLFSECSFLSKSPSRKQLTLVQELQARELMYAFLIKLGIELKLDGRTILAATVYISRFYMRMPITTSKYFFICAAIAISCKLHDCYREPDRIALKGCELRNPNKQVDQHCALFWQWRDQLLYREEIMLKMLNFELDIDLPYDFVEDLLEEKDPDSSNGFFVKLPEIFKHSLSKVELLSAWPILVAFDMRSIFGMALVLTVKEAQDKFLDEFAIEIPAHYLEARLRTTVLDCYHCYKYVNKLKSVCEDSKQPCHKNLVGKIIRISKDLFLRIAQGKTVEEQPKNKEVQAEKPLLFPEEEN